MESDSYPAVGSLRLTGGLQYSTWISIHFRPTFASIHPRVLHQTAIRHETLYPDIAFMYNDLFGWIMDQL